MPHLQIAFSPCSHDASRPTHGSLDHSPGNLRLAYLYTLSKLQTSCNAFVTINASIPSVAMTQSLNHRHTCSNSTICTASTGGHTPPSGFGDGLCSEDPVLPPLCASYRLTLSLDDPRPRSPVYIPQKLYPAFKEVEA